MAGQDYEHFEADRVTFAADGRTIIGVVAGREPLLCRGCGAMVGDTQLHDRWHDGTRFAPLPADQYQENQV